MLRPPLTEQEAIGETLAALDEEVRIHTGIARAGEYRALLADLLMAGRAVRTRPGSVREP
ncbi:hypothetical protein [Streptomyces sp. NPDC051636]|uniref:hypothetical protein n=1 Tax=Streptomyces sp. NPDC051636 TaxID=3365663 RepID=UPI0037A45BA4